MDNIRLNRCVKELKKGKQQYFDEFFELTKNAVFYITFSVLKNQEEANDVMQETYITFLNNLISLDCDKNFHAYLLTIARNKAINVYNQRRFTASIENEEFLSAEAPTIFDSIDTPLLLLCKEKMPAEEWQLIELAVIQGYNRTEIANMLGKPLATIYWQYNKAIEKVKHYYKEVYDER
ncbi:MAG: sigma-70 family RNA polymerase sigma factor [Clostridia bacterium]